MFLVIVKFCSNETANSVWFEYYTINYFLTCLFEPYHSVLLALSRSEVRTATTSGQYYPVQPLRLGNKK